MDSKVHPIAAGIVLFNPDINRLEENISAIYSQVDFIILVDNASSNINEIESKYDNDNRIILIKNNENLGIAKALNQIIVFCDQNNCEWVLTLDQDSVCPTNLVGEFKNYLDFDNIGIICPRIIDRNFLMECQEQIVGTYEYIDRCITSASLTNIKICKEIGYFDEEMFIDLVDFEYCVRLRKAGYSILRLNDISLLHQLGDLKVYNILGKKIRITNHSEFRKYYITRNTIYFANKHKDYINKRNIYLKLLFSVIKTILFENNKLKKLSAMLRGYMAGIKMV